MQTNTNQLINLSSVVDELAIVKAQLAELADKEKELKATLIAAGVSPVEGDLHRATVSLVSGRTTIDWKAIAEHFNPSRQLVTAHTSKGADYHMIRVTARKGVKS
jgi:hypothetical protein